MGYNEYTLEKGIRDSYLTSYMEGGKLINFKYEGKTNLSWFVKSKSLSLSWKKSLKFDEVDFYKFYFSLYKIEDEDEKK